jgi:hypothetical protein
MSRASVGPLVGVALVLWAPLLAAPVPRSSPAQVRKELDAQWADLLSADELTAGRALLGFAARRDEVVNYLKGKLRPLKLSKARAKKLLERLGSDDGKTVRAAFEEFAYLDPRLALGDEDLRDALLDRPASRRLAAALCDLPVDALANGKWHWYSPDNKVYRFNYGEAVRDQDVSIAVAGIGTQGRKSSWVRAVRAVAVLEHVGTWRAMALLKTLATGHPDAAPTKAARVALGRLRKK